MNFECHITVALADREIAQEIADAQHWSTSEIERDPVLGKASYFYLTTHAREFKELWDRMERAEDELSFRDIKVIRSKIEAILYDTKGKT